MKLKKFVTAVTAAAIVISCMSSCAEASAAEKMRDITTMELVQEMGLGINLGNTFESCGGWISNTSVTNYETGWGSPVVTEELIQRL